MGLRNKDRLMAQVLVVGMATIDFIFEVDAMPASAEKYVAHNARIVGGGGAANAACAIATLGGRAMLAARVGDDMVGHLVAEDLKRSAVDCSLLQVSKGAASSYSSVLIDKQGDRQIVNYRGAQLSDDVSLIDSASPEAVLADTRWVAGATAALQLAAANNVPGVLDAEAPLDRRLMSLASHIAFSKQGLESIQGPVDGASQIEAALRQVANDYPVWLAVTDGSNGVYSLYRGEFSHEPARQVDVLDTLGAGDVWHGVFTLHLSCGNDEKKSVKFANAAATLKCREAEGGRFCPTLREVEAFMQ